MLWRKPVIDIEDHSFMGNTGSPTVIIFVIRRADDEASSCERKKKALFEYSTVIRRYFSDRERTVEVHKCRECFVAILHVGRVDTHRDLAAINGYLFVLYSQSGLCSVFG